MNNNELRNALTEARRIVVKIGSRVLVSDQGRPNQPRINSLAGELAALRHAGRDVAVVSSGAIGSGMEALGMKTRPQTIPDLQMAAAVGQAALMARYNVPFQVHGCQIGQVLLTYDDLHHRQRHLNARNALMNLLRHGIIPIINENDVVAVDEIKFGDNDILASLVSILIEADLLILLSTTDGLKAPDAKARMRRVPLLQAVTQAELRVAVGKGGAISTGGMESKLKSAQQAADAGVAVVIADGRQPGVLPRVLAGEDVGTLIAPDRAGREALRAGRKRWLAYFHRVAGALVVDDGARRALVCEGKSLLPIGIKSVEGTFEPGALVNIKDTSGVVVARGLTDYSSAQILRIKGHPTRDISAILGAADFNDVVHRDNLAVLAK